MPHTRSATTTRCGYR